ncbi:MAG: hypothetical protein Q9N32_06545 [Gammaproteobacteria bacterium]|nr:hypothetical protein [Gammaproteobacteria bacterium]
MKVPFFIAISFAFFVSSVSAGTIDFSSSTYNTTTSTNTATDFVDGVNFNITVTSQGADRFVQAFGNAGLSFGVPGNGMHSISIVADQDLTYTSLTGRGHTLINNAGQLPFDISANGSLAIDNLMFSPSVFTVASLGSISILAGQALLIDVDFSALTGSSIFASATLQSLDFSKAGVSAVPIPAAALLFAPALLSFLGFRRKISG